MDDLTGVGKTLEKFTELTKELRDFIPKVFGPAAEETGELLRDNVKFLRFKNAVKTFGQAEQLLRDNGISPKAVPLKMLIPILEDVPSKKTMTTSSRNGPAYWRQPLLVIGSTPAIQRS